MAAAEIASTRSPADVLRERLDDPNVAASLLNILDHADLLSVLVSGLHELVSRSDTIMESVSTSVGELTGASRAASASDVKLPNADELRNLVAELSHATPVLTKVLGTRMVNDQTIDFLSMASDSVVAGQTAAQSKKTSVRGIRGMLAVLKDRDVGRGLGLMVEIARALGQRLETTK